MVPRPSEPALGEAPIDIDKPESIPKTRLQKITENPLFKALLIPSKLVVGGLKEGASRTEKGISTGVVIGAGAGAGAAAAVGTILVLKGGGFAVKHTKGAVSGAKKRIQSNAKAAQKTGPGRWLLRRLGRSSEIKTK